MAVLFDNFMRQILTDNFFGGGEGGGGDGVEGVTKKYELRISFENIKRFSSLEHGPETDRSDSAF